MKTILIFRWAARILSVGLAALLAALAICEGPPPILPLSLHTLPFSLLAVCVAGLLVAYRCEALGASLALVSIVGFYLNDFVMSGFRSLPGGWVFPLLLATSLLYLAASALQRYNAMHQNSQSPA